MSQIQTRKFTSILTISILFILLTPSCGSDPRFEVEGNCIKKEGRLWFQSVHITINDPSGHYLLTRNRSLDGSHRICFNDVPEGYYIISNKDTLDTRVINLSEGDIILIRNSGGDRAAMEMKCFVRNGSLIEVSGNY